MHLGLGLGVSVVRGAPGGDAPTFVQNFLDSTSLTQAARVGPVLDFSRGTTAWYFGSDGYAKEAAAGEARFDHDPTTGESLGLLVEDSATYELRSSRDLSAADWDTTGATIAQDQVGLGGNANTGWSVTGDDATQSLTVTDDSDTHTLAFPIRKDGDDTRVFAQFTGGTTTLDYQADLDVSAGTVTAGGDAASGDLEVRDWGDFWMVAISATNNGTGNTTLTYGFRPVTLSETAKYDNGAIHLNRSVAPVSPPMPTGGSAVTRAADDVSTTDLGWYNDGGAGTFACEFTGWGDLSNEYPFRVSGDFNNSLVQVRFSLGDIAYFIKNDGSFSVNGASNSKYTRGEVIKLSAGYNSQGTSLYINTLKEITDDTVVPPDGIKELRVGDFRAGAAILNGHIASLEYYPIRLSDAELQRKSSQT